MANYCYYKGIVRGKRNACHAFFGSMPAYDDKRIEEKNGSDSLYTLRFEGNCKWLLSRQPWNGDAPVELPKDETEAERYGEDNCWDISIQDCSKMFNVEVWCNSYCEGDEYSTFEHYVNGNSVESKCPFDICFDEVINQSVDPVEPNRVKAYYEGENNDIKSFDCQYKNEIIENILVKYNYSSDDTWGMEDPTNINDLTDVIPDYKGVQTIEELTSTLISALVSFGNSDDGFEEELNSRKAEIQKAFVFIEGTSQETMTGIEELEDGIKVLYDGFSFEMINGEYSASYWQEYDEL